MLKFFLWAPITQWHHICRRQNITQKKSFCGTPYWRVTPTMSERTHIISLHLIPGTGQLWSGFAIQSNSSISSIKTLSRWVQIHQLQSFSFNWIQVEGAETISGKRYLHIYAFKDICIQRYLHISAFKDICI